MYKVGLSVGTILHNDESFAGLAESGIKNVEISPKYDEYPLLDYKELKRLSDTHGVNIWSYHLPFSTVNEFDIASMNEELRKKSVDYWCECIKKATDIGIDKFVAHPSSEPKSEGEAREEEIKRSMQSLSYLAEVADRCGAIIAVEDLPRSCLCNTADEILRIISADERLRICFDTNHLLGDTNENFLKKCAGKIATVHISDYDFVNERHWLCGEGKIDWQNVYKGLVDSGYKGVWLYEIGLKTPKTIIRDRDLTFDDFVKNANEVFNNKPLTVLGRQKENLGMWE